MMNYVGASNATSLLDHPAIQNYNGRQSWKYRSTADHLFQPHLPFEAEDEDAFPSMLEVDRLQLHRYRLPAERMVVVLVLLRQQITQLHDRWSHFRFWIHLQLQQLNQSKFNRMNF